MYFWGAGNHARLDSVDPVARGRAPRPLSPFGHQAEGEGSGIPGMRIGGPEAGAGQAHRAWAEPAALGLMSAPPLLR